MACTFELEITDNPETFTEKVKAALVKAGGIFKGDAANASFSLSTPVGSIEGSYKTSANKASVTITEKPFFLSCDKIKEVIQGYLK